MGTSPAEPADYDSLPADQKAAVREAWEAETDRRAASSDIAADKHAAGQPVVTLDEDGNVVRRLPDGSVERV